MLTTKKAAWIVKTGNKLNWTLCGGASLMLMLSLIILELSAPSILKSWDLSKESVYVYIIGAFAMIMLLLMILKGAADNLRAGFKRCYEVPAPKNSVECKLAHPLVMKNLCRVAIEAAAAKREYEKFLNRPADFNASPESVKAAFAEHDRLLAEMNAKNKYFQKAFVLAGAFKIGVTLTLVDDLVGVAKRYGVETIA
jgi:hypothetical protein